MTYSLAELPTEHFVEILATEALVAIRQDREANDHLVAFP